MHMKTRIVLTLMLIICTVVPAAAQGGAWLGPQLSIYKATDAVDTRMMGGGALRFKFNEAVGIEGSINYREEAYDNGYVNVRTWPVMVTGLFYPVPVVYGAIGAGWYNTAIDYNLPAGYYGNMVTVETERQQEFGWHFGGGVELPLSPHAKLIGDLRYTFLNYDFQYMPGSGAITSNFYAITVGVLFHI